MFKLSKVGIKMKFNKDKIKGLIIGVIGTSIIGMSVLSFAEMQSIQAFFNDIKIQINGKSVDTGNDKPFIYNGRTYVPTRYVAEGLGATVKWNESSNTVEIESVAKVVYAHVAVPTPMSIVVDPDLINYKVIKFQNGDKYVGEVKDGIPSGVGSCSYSDGKFFYGSWKNGKRNGEGVTHMVNGDKFAGELTNDEVTGHGVYLFADGSIYCGQLSDSQMNGKGMFKVSDKEYYFGDYLNNSISGKGTYYYSNGNSYFGDFMNFKRNGFGAMINTSSNVLSGMWNQDQFVNNNIPIVNNNTPIANNIAPITPIAHITTVAPTPTPVNTVLLAEQKRQYEQALSDLQTIVNNTRSEHTTKVFVGDKFEFQADPNAVARAEKNYQDKLNQYNLWKAANGQ